MRASLFVGFLGLFVTVVACSGKTEDPAVEQLMKNADGSPTGDGATCSYGGKTAPVGGSFTAPDGCNTCRCAPEGAYCTQKACAGGTCAYEGRIYKKGDTFTCADGCNTCTCGEDGMVSGTLMGCLPSDCNAKDACGPALRTPTISCVDGTTGGPVCEPLEPAGCGWNIRKCTCLDESGKQWQPGETFAAECNTCTCLEDGSAACTDMACPCPPPGTVIDCEPPVDHKPRCKGPRHDWIVDNCPGVTFAL